LVVVDVDPRAGRKSIIGPGGQSSAGVEVTSSGDQMRGHATGVERPDLLENGATSSMWQRRGNPRDDGQTVTGGDLPRRLLLCEGQSGVSATVHPERLAEAKRLLSCENVSEILDRALTALIDNELEQVHAEGYARRPQGDDTVQTVDPGVWADLPWDDE
jgi:hypothetical protein